MTNLQPFRALIAKLAESDNPVVQDLATELSASVDDSGPELNADFSVDPSLAMGDQKDKEPKDAVDVILSEQMKDLGDAENTNQSPITSAKMATVRDVLLARVRRKL